MLTAVMRRKTNAIGTEMLLLDAIGEALLDPAECKRRMHMDWSLKW